MNIDTLCAIVNSVYTLQPRFHPCKIKYGVQPD